MQSSYVIMILMVLLPSSMSVSSVHADELFLEKGGSVEGQVLAEAIDSLEIRTFTGTLTVPKVIIARRDYNPSRLDHYINMLNASPISEQRHIELARWCLNHQLDQMAHQHAIEALTLNPANIDARKIGGYVRIGDVWLHADHASPTVNDTRRTERIVDQLTTGWYRRVRSIHDDFLNGSDNDSRSVTNGLAQLASIKSPLSIPAACRFLYTSNITARRALAEHLAAFTEDVARLNLIAVALLDDDADVRSFTADQIAVSYDIKMVQSFQSALRCDNDIIARRAAVVLGKLKDRSAVEDLINALTTDGFKSEHLTTRSVFDQAIQTFNTPLIVPLTDTTHAITPTLLLPNINRLLESYPTHIPPTPPQNRSEVQEALIAITQQNHGFNATAWTEWLKNNPPLLQP